jgi:hypothetical protein
MKTFFMFGHFLSILSLLTIYQSVILSYNQQGKEPTMTNEINALTTEELDQQAAEARKAARAKVRIARVSREMTSFCIRLDALSQQTVPTNTGNAKLDALNARLNDLNEWCGEFAIELLDNTTDKPASYYGGSLKTLNREEAAQLKALIAEELDNA